MRKIQADTLRGDVIPAPDVFPAGEQAAYVGRAYLVGTTDHFHRNMQLPGQKRHMTCELVHLGILEREYLPVPGDILGGNGKRVPSLG